MDRYVIALGSVAIVAAVAIIFLAQISPSGTEPLGMASAAPIQVSDTSHTVSISRYTSAKLIVGDRFVSLGLAGIGEGYATVAIDSEQHRIPEGGSARFVVGEVPVVVTLTGLTTQTASVSVRLEPALSLPQKKEPVPEAIAPQPQATAVGSEPSDEEPTSILPSLTIPARGLAVWQWILLIGVALLTALTLADKYWPSGQAFDFDIEALRIYVSKMRRKGMPEKDIYAKVLDRGWPQHLVKKTLSEPSY